MHKETASLSTIIMYYLAIFLSRIIRPVGISITRVSFVPHGLDYVIRVFHFLSCFYSNDHMITDFLSRMVYRGSHMWKG